MSRRGRSRYGKHKSALAREKLIPGAEPMSLGDDDPVDKELDMDINDLLREIADKALDAELERRRDERTAVTIAVSECIRDVGYRGMYYFVKLRNSCCGVSVQVMGQICLIAIGIGQNTDYAIQLVRSLAMIYGTGGVSQFDFDGHPSQMESARVLYDQVREILQFRNAKIIMCGSCSI